MRNQQVDEYLNKIREALTPYDLGRAGLSIRVFKNVYPTSELSELVVECMDNADYGIRPGNKVLDYGTGTGFLAIQAAIRGAKVVAIDINPDAVDCAKFNVSKHNQQLAVDVRLGKSLEPLRPGEKFDIILAGLPWDDAETSEFIEMSMYDPWFQMRRELFAKAKDILLKEGRIFFTYAEFAQKRNPIENSFNGSYIYSTLRQRILKEVPHYVYLIQPNIC